MLKVNSLPTNARFNVAQLRKKRGGHLHPCGVLMQKERSSTGDPASSTRQGGPLHGYLEVLQGSISPRSAVVAVPQNRQVGIPLTAPVALPVDATGGVF